MDVLLQTHGAKKIFPVPDGLRELTSDIIREVLRHQPDCIHSFIADYLETMLIVREKARDSAAVVCDIFRQGYFLDDLYRSKKVNREAADMHASIIQAGWRGYVIRKKFRMYLQKRRKLQEEKELKKSMKIEEFLESIGITYEEATRAACIIQAAYRRARLGTWIVNESGEVCIEGEIPIGQRIREGDKAQGRYDRWEKKDWGDFFEMDDQGEIMYDWPHVGQLRKIPRKLVTPDMEILQFYAMRDLQGKEQYSYLKGPQKVNPRGFPVGFLIPLPKENIDENSSEVVFVNAMNNMRMGMYSYVFEKHVEKEDLNKFAEVLKERNDVKERIKLFLTEIQGEFDYDPDWVVPKIIIQIHKDSLRDTDDEVMFVNEEAAPDTSGVYTFRAENTDTSLKVIERVLGSNCGAIEEALADAVNMTEYKQSSTGRFLAVEDFKTPKYIQKVIIQPETKTGSFENRDMDNFEYVFLPKNYYRLPKRWKKPENPITIPLTRFQGHRSNYLGSLALDNQIFIMGPMLHSPDGKPINYESIFWDEFGPECWYQLLCDITNKKIARLAGLMEEEAGEAEEQVEEEEEEEENEEEEEVQEQEDEEGKEEQEEEAKDEQEETAKQPESEETAQATEADTLKTEETEQKTELQEIAEQKAEEQNTVEGGDALSPGESVKETEPQAEEAEEDKE